MSGSIGEVMPILKSSPVRRGLPRLPLVAATALWVLGVALAAGANAEDPGRDSKLIERENAKPGATDWQLTRVRVDDPNGFRSPWIEGYCSKQSVKAGETLDILVSTDPPRKFEIQ